MRGYKVGNWELSVMSPLRGFANRFDCLGSTKLPSYQTDAQLGLFKWADVFVDENILLKYFVKV